MTDIMSPVQPADVKAHVALHLQEPCIIELTSDEESSLTPQDVRLAARASAHLEPSFQRVEPLIGTLSNPLSSMEEMSSMDESDGFAQMDTIKPVRSRRLRRAHHLMDERNPPILASVRIFNTEISYRQCGSVLHFHLDSFLELIPQLLPLASDVRVCKAVTKLTHEKKDETSWRKDYLSWSVLRVLILDGIYHQALKDMLNTYQPFEDHVPKSKANRLVDDTIHIVGVDIAFIVCKGKIYLEILGSFTILGELKLAMRNKWQEVDQILAEHGIRQRDAFRRCYKSTAATEKASYSQRSHIALKSLQVLVESGMLSNPDRKTTLTELFHHIEKRADVIAKRRDRLLGEIQLHVDMIMRATSYLRRNNSVSSEDDDVRYFTPSSEDESGPDDIGSDSRSETSQSVQLGPDTCCGQKHSLTLDGKPIGYILKDETIFLEKCATFMALGRMYVIRCSDYRKADKILLQMDLDPNEHYLHERRSVDKVGSRHRRTHISVVALRVLVDQGFADPNETKTLKGDLQDLEARLPELKAQCQASSAPDPHQTPSEPASVATPAKMESPHAHEEVAGPYQTKPESLEESEAAVQALEGLSKLKILGREVPSRVEHQKVYLHLGTITNFLSDEDRLVPRLKRHARTLELKFPFFPSYFRKGSEQFISGECLLGLVEKNLVSTLGGQKQLLVQDLLHIIRESEEALVPEDANLDGGEINEDEEEETLHFKEDDSKAVTINFLGDKARVKILQGLVPFQVVNDIIYLDLASIFTLFHSSGREPTIRAFRAMDRLVEQAQICLDDAFLYQGRKRALVSLGGLRVLVENNFLLNGSNLSRQFLDRLDQLEEHKGTLKDNRKLTLKSFGSLSFQVHKGHVHVNMLQVMRLVGFSPNYLDNSPSKACFIICKLLSQRGMNMDTCFARQGKSKYCNIALHALFCLFETEVGPFKERDKTTLLQTEILDAIQEQNIGGLVLDRLREQVTNASGFVGSPEGGVVAAEPTGGNDKMIKIGAGFRPIRYKIQDDVLFLQRRTCFESIGLEKAIMTCSRGYVPINDILGRNSQSLGQSYLSGKRERYAFIAVQALLTILEAQDPMIVCLQNKEKFTEALLTTMQSGAAHALTFQSTKAELDLSPVHRLTLMDSSQAIPFKVCGNRIYLSRHISYGLAGLYDKAEGTSCHGEYDIFEDPVTPLTDRGLHGTDCFLSDGGDSFAYISIDALLILMNLDGDISRAGDYSKLIWKNLLSAIAMESPKLRVHVKMTAFKKDLVQTLLDKFVFFLENAKSIENRGDDFVEMVDLVTEAEETEDEDMPVVPLKRPRMSSGSSSHSHEGIPPVKRVRSSESSSILAEDMDLREEEYIRDLLRQAGIESAASSPRALGTRSPSSNSELSDQGDVPTLGTEPLSPRDFFTLKESTRAHLTQGGTIGDWHVVQCDEAMLRFLVEPGHGASRKMSFIHPDVSAILRYELILKPSSVPQLMINTLCVSPALVSKHVEECLEKGILNLLFQFLTFRPCFGSFAPEMVETVSKNIRTPNLYVDQTFIGSSQNGRTYAGTVRARHCRVLAQSRVSDVCQECSLLKDFVINRSVLGESREPSPQAGEPKLTPQRKRATSLCTESGGHHKSVWKVESSSAEGVTFVCPQLQSYNTSLPHAFSGSKQASSIVEHRVHISQDLRAAITLNGRRIDKGLPEYEKTKKVGPLLEWVASFRLCVGYPDVELSAQAKYLKANHQVLQPTIRKFFKHIEVDESFKGTMMAEPILEFQGTIRTPSCRYLAGEHSDICEECRLLQEPIEFLGL